MSNMAKTPILFGVPLSSSNVSDFEQISNNATTVFDWWFDGTICCIPARADIKSFRHLTLGCCRLKIKYNLTLPFLACRWVFGAKRPRDCLIFSVSLFVREARSLPTTGQTDATTWAIIIEQNVHKGWVTF